MPSSELKRWERLRWQLQLGNPCRERRLRVDEAGHVSYSCASEEGLRSVFDARGDHLGQC
eukprot:4161450-Amphidinium_carterae.1